MIDSQGGFLDVESDHSPVVLFWEACCSARGVVPDHPAVLCAGCSQQQHVSQRMLGPSRRCQGRHKGCSQVLGKGCKAGSPRGPIQAWSGKGRVWFHTVALNNVSSSYSQQDLAAHTRLWRVSFPAVFVTYQASSAQSWSHQSASMTNMRSGRDRQKAVSVQALAARFHANVCCTCLLYHCTE